MDRRPLIAVAIAATLAMSGQAHLDSILKLEAKATPMTIAGTKRGAAIELLLLGLIAPLSAPLAADELKLDAGMLFARSVARQLSLESDRSAIKLQRGVLIEDDGPAAGYSYQPNTERLGPRVWIRKELIVASPQADSATLLIGGSGDLTTTINGQQVALDSIGKQGNYWQAHRFPPAALRRGKNEFVLRGAGSVWIARDDEFAAGASPAATPSNRSAKSVDEGASWDDQRLGTDNNIDGEYCVRLFLDQHHPQGRLALDVIDVGNLSENPIGPPVESVEEIRIAADVSLAPSSSIALRARTGTTYVPDEKHWSDWIDIEAAEGKIAQPRGRYLQVELTLATRDPLASPSLQGLFVAATVRRPANWTSALRVTKIDNTRIARSMIPFRYEPFDRPELAELRRKYDLDAVVAGAATEFDLIKRLAAWSATRWERMHLKEAYPPYDALKILEPHPDGAPVGGFCQQYNIVFLQACESFGIAGRLVSIGPGNMTDRIRGGHETAEIWSNQWRKWIYIDGNTAWYAVDQETETPLSLWELRLRQLAAFRGEAHRPIRVVVLEETKHEWPNLTSWPPFVELRLIPRSNFLQEKTPLPLNQGMRGWFWTGHFVWTDDTEPARLLYSNRVERRADFEWAVNQAHLAFEATRPGTLRIHVDSDTPSFKTYLRRTGGAAAPTEAVFDWQLVPGRNRLEIAPQNVAGREGIAASVELTWLPPEEKPPARPNIVLIMADDLGFSDLGCYGGEIETPNLDRLAGEGLRFSQFYNGAVCRISRTCLLTGLHPRREKGRLLQDNMTTLAEVAQSAGYRTSLIGKWHFPVTRSGDKSRLPTRRGFDEFYGLAAGCCNYFNPARPFPDFYRGQGPEPFLDQETPITDFPPDFYATDAFTARAVEAIEKFSRGAEQSPFFLHLCYTAPHYPLHAKPQDIARYKGRYDDGYFALRKRRAQRLVELGLIDPQWKLSEPDPQTSQLAYDYSITPWEEIPDLSRERRRMEVYAAMVDSMDHGIGRVLEAIERTGQADNTLVMFLSDNGGCASHSGYHDEAVRKAHAAYNTDLPGAANTYDYVAQGWGWAQNAPFRRYKVWTHEGGISTPLIARWPGVIRPGSLTDQVGHVVDFMPTLLEVSGAAYPEKRGGAAILPTEGISLLPIFKGKTRRGHESLCWYLYGNRAVRQGKWKLVWGGNDKRWALFDMERDRTETNDLATKQPQRVAQMASDWLKWAQRTGAPLQGAGL